MYSKRIQPAARPVGSSVHEPESESVRFVAQAIPEIPELSHGIQDRRPRHSKHPSLLAMPAVFSAFSITLVGRFPELTPVHSQTTSRGFLPWMPVTLSLDVHTTTHGTYCAHPPHIHRTLISPFP